MQDFRVLILIDPSTKAIRAVVMVHAQALNEFYRKNPKHGHNGGLDLIEVNPAYAGSSKELAEWIDMTALLAIDQRNNCRPAKEEITVVENPFKRSSPKS